MNDALLRENFHRKVLGRYHSAPDVLVVDELGLIHGKGRADIAVVNGHLVGYEIKSDDDSLARLSEQVEMYNAVFDRNTIVVGEKHAKNIRSQVPRSWGIMIGRHHAKQGVQFQRLRRAIPNTKVDPYALAQLLWSNEAASILEQLGEPPKILRQRRSALYELLIKKLSLTELRRRVTKSLKSRKNWRPRARHAPSDGLFPPTAK